MNPVKPYGKRVAVEVLGGVEERERASGIVLPMEEDSHVHRAMVVSVGEDVDHLTQGCVVYYPKHRGLEIGPITVVDAEVILAWEEP